MRKFLGRARRRLKRLARQSRLRTAAPRKSVAPAKLAIAVPKRLSRRGSDPFDAYSSWLPDHEKLRVVILAGEGQRTQPLRWLDRFADDEIWLLSDREDPSWDVEQRRVQHRRANTVAAKVRALRTIGPVDVLVNLLEAEQQEHVSMWRKFFFHLRPNGLYIIDQQSRTARAFVNPLAGWMFTIYDPAEPTRPPRMRARATEYIGAIAAVTITRDFVIVRKQHKHYLKVAHHDADQVLPGREPNLKVSVLDRLPAGEYQARAAVTSHQSSTQIDLVPETMPYPELQLREYQGPVCFGGTGLVFTNTNLTVLPPSFRHHLSANPDNQITTDAGAGFVRIRPELQPKKKLAGLFYNLDTSRSFGHFTSEAISRLWGWDEAKRRHPELKALIRVRQPNKDGLERAVFRAYGIADDDIVSAPEPVEVRDFITATAMWHNAEPYYVHPDLPEVWHRLTEKLYNPDQPTSERIFISRSPRWQHRVCRNTAEVEQYFAERGFTIVYPEELDIRQQVTLFRGATTVAGFGGSGLFNVMHSQSLRNFIVLSHEAYTARNEGLFAAALGGHIHYFWSKPDVVHPEDDWSVTAFFSEWEFDFERNRADLDDVIANL
jgi:capsular polysaccharide biosynthesis protein